MKVHNQNDKPHDESNFGPQHLQSGGSGDGLGDVTKAMPSEGGKQASEAMQQANPGEQKVVGSTDDPECMDCNCACEPTNDVAAALPDPFDPSALHLGADYSEGLGVRKVISTIPVRKPHKSEWFRVRPGPDWRLQTAILEVESGVDRAAYLVARNLWSDLSEETSPALVLTCVNRLGDLFLWRVKLPGPDGRTNTWTESALRISQAAETTWCRMTADMPNGHYTHYEPTGVLPEPKWPEMPFNEILRIAFRGRMIGGLDHPIVRELRGAT